MPSCIQMQILYNYNAFRFKIAKLFNYFNVKLCIWTGTTPVVNENINAWKKSRPQLFALIAQSSRWSSWPGRRVGTCLKRWAHETKEIHIDIENWLQKKTLCIYINVYSYIYIYIHIIADIAASFSSSNKLIRFNKLYTRYLIPPHEQGSSKTNKPNNIKQCQSNYEL